VHLLVKIKNKENDNFTRKKLALIFIRFFLYCLTTNQASWTKYFYLIWVGVKPDSKEYSAEYFNRILGNEVNVEIKIRHRNTETTKGTNRPEEICRKKKESGLRICSYSLKTVRCTERR